MAFAALAKKTAGPLVLGAILSAASVTAVPTEAVARDGWRDHGRGGPPGHAGHQWRGDHGRGGHHWRGHHGHHRGGDGAGVALGLLGGALAGAALSNAYNYNYYNYAYPYGYSYSYPYYGYYGY